MTYVLDQTFELIYVNVKNRQRNEENKQTNKYESRTNYGPCHTPIRDIQQKYEF